MNQRIPFPQGHCAVHLVDEAGVWLPPLFEKHNQIAYDWGVIACQAMCRGNSLYKIRGMYVEFENVADPEDTISIPSDDDIDRGEGVNYFLSLSGSKDFLRVLMDTEPGLTVGSNSAYQDYFSGEGVEFNEATFRAQSSSSSGVNGLSFDNGSNSKIYGIALVAVPDIDDVTRDKIFGRLYFNAGEQFVKPSTQQVGVAWSQLFG